jgi:hypothetical protein
VRSGLKLCFAFFLVWGLADSLFCADVEFLSKGRHCCCCSKDLGILLARVAGTDDLFLFSAMKLLLYKMLFG